MAKSFNSGTIYRFEGVHDNFYKLWHATAVDAQLGFSEGIAQQDARFRVHNIGNKIAIESVKFPGNFLQVWRNPDDTHPHLRKEHIRIAAGNIASLADSYLFIVSDPIWAPNDGQPGDHITEDAFTLKHGSHVMVSGLGGIVMAPYTASTPDKNWGFVFRASSHSYEITMPNGDIIETPPFPLAYHSTLGQANSLAGASDYDGNDDWRLPSPEEMKEIIKQLKPLGVIGSHGAYWTNQASSTSGSQTVVNAGNLSKSARGHSYHFTLTIAVRSK